MKRKWLFRVLFLTCLSGGLCGAPTGAPQGAASTPPPAPLQVQKLKGSLYWVKGGSGASTGFYVGEKEVLVIDAKTTAESARQMIAEISKISANPIRRVLLTHSDGDHVTGLEGFPREVSVFCQEKSAGYIDKAFTRPEARAFLPQVTFSDRMTLFLGEEPQRKAVQFFYLGPAHTDGDAVVLFPEEKVAFVGDLVFLGRDPLIHRAAKNGTSIGLVKVLKALLAMDIETFVSGHADPVGKEEVARLVQSIEEKQKQVGALVKEGKNWDQIRRQLGGEDPAQAAGPRRWMSLLEVIFLDLTEKK